MKLMRIAAICLSASVLMGATCDANIMKVGYFEYALSRCPSGESALPESRALGEWQVERLPSDSSLFACPGFFYYEVSNKKRRIGPLFGFPQQSPFHAKMLRDRDCRVRMVFAFDGRAGPRLLELRQYADAAARAFGATSATTAVQPTDGFQIIGGKAALERWCAEQSQNASSSENEEKASPSP
jgi:hypothetical protein